MRLSEFESRGSSFWKCTLTCKELPEAESKRGVGCHTCRPTEVEARPAADGEGEEDAQDALVAQPIPALLQSLERRMGLGRIEELCSHATSALGLLAAATDAPWAGPAPGAGLASALCMLAPMLRMLHGALCQLALQYLVAHKATAKLAYVAASLFAGLVQEGFCMPEGEPAGRCANPVGPRWWHVGSLARWVGG